MMVDESVNMSRKINQNLELGNFDDVLRYVGGWGKFQWILIAALLPTYIFLAFSNYTPILFLYTPEFRCRETSINASYALQCPCPDNHVEFNLTGYFTTVVTGKFLQGLSCMDWI